MEIKFLIVIIGGLGVLFFEFFNDLKGIRKFNNFINKNEKEKFIDKQFTIRKVERKIGMQNGYFIHTAEKIELNVSDILESNLTEMKLINLLENQKIIVKVKEFEYNKVTGQSGNIFKRFLDKFKGMKSLTIYELRDNSNKPILFENELEERLIKNYKKEKRQKIGFAISKVVFVIALIIIYKVFVK